MKVEKLLKVLGEEFPPSSEPSAEEISQDKLGIAKTRMDYLDKMAYKLEEISDRMKKDGADDAAKYVMDAATNLHDAVMSMAHEVDPELRA
jgi:hypothetical protein